MSLLGRLRPAAREVLPRPLDAVCPFLALEGDGRTALEVPDRHHRCHAVQPRAELTRAEQAGLCLTRRHLGCPRYVARQEAAPADGVSAADAAEPGWQIIDVPSTRLVALPAPVPLSSRVAAVTRPLGAATSGVAVLALVVWAAAFAGEWDSGETAASRWGASRQVALATEAPLATPSEAVATRTPAPTSTPPAVGPAPIEPLPTAPPEPTVYVVKQGDTLWSIATQFGTTPDVIMAYNGLETDILQIDQVLLIP